MQITVQISSIYEGRVLSFQKNQYSYTFNIPREPAESDLTALTLKITASYDLIFMRLPEKCVACASC
jgi:hypothetical protein